MPCISGLIHQYCKNTDTEFDCLKRGTSYVYVTLSRTVDDRRRTIQFADVLVLLRIPFSSVSPCFLPSLVINMLALNNQRRDLKALN